MNSLLGTYTQYINFSVMPQYTAFMYHKICQNVECHNLKNAFLIVRYPYSLTVHYYK